MFGTCHSAKKLSDIYNILVPHLLEGQVKVGRGESSLEGLREWMDNRYKIESLNSLKVAKSGI